MDRATYTRLEERRHAGTLDADAAALLQAYERTAAGQPVRLAAALMGLVAAAVVGVGVGVLLVHEPLPLPEPTTTQAATRSAAATAPAAGPMSTPASMPGAPSVR